MAQPVDLLVDGGVLFDIGVRMGDIGLRLIIIVVRNEVFHRVVGEKLPELTAKLSRQGLVVGQYQRGTIQFFDDGGHGKGLAGTGNAQKRLLPQSPVHAVDKTFNGFRLVAGRLVIRNQFKIHTVSPNVLIGNTVAGLHHGYVVILCHDDVICQRDLHGG